MYFQIKREIFSLKKRKPHLSAAHFVYACGMCVCDIIYYCTLNFFTMTITSFAQSSFKKYFVSSQYGVYGTHMPINTKYDAQQEPLTIEYKILTHVIYLYCVLPLPLFLSLSTITYTPYRTAHNASQCHVKFNFFIIFILLLFLSLISGSTKAKERKIREKNLSYLHVA